MAFHAFGVYTYLYFNCFSKWICLLVFHIISYLTGYHSSPRHVLHRLQCKFSPCKLYGGLHVRGWKLTIGKVLIGAHALATRNLAIVGISYASLGLATLAYGLWRVRSALDKNRSEWYPFFNSDLAVYVFIFTSSSDGFHDCTWISIQHYYICTSIRPATNVM